MSTWTSRGFQRWTRVGIYKRTVEANGGDLASMVRIIQFTNPEISRERAENALLLWQAAAFGNLEGTAQYGRQNGPGRSVQALDGEGHTDR